MKQNAELRLMAREQLKGNWGIPILVCFLFTLIISIPGGIRDAGWFIGVLITGPMMLGQIQYFTRFSEGEKPPVEALFGGFKQFVPSMLLQLIVTILIALWSLLLIIPGIIAALSYSQSLYILNDNPGIEVMEALRQSKKMMEGYKSKLFMMWLSFAGWGLLCIFTLGIGFLWLAPYIQLSLVHFYADLKTTKV